MYNKIFYVPGNHEYYNLLNNKKSKTECDEELDLLSSKFDNIVILNNKTYYIDDVKMIGTTLWSNIPDEQSVYINKSINFSTEKSVFVSKINDYYMIKKYDNHKLVPITTDDTNKWNRESIEFIQQQTDNIDVPCIILTHHSPLFSDDTLNIYTAHPKYLNGKNNFAFHNDLKYLLKKPIGAWLYGHTHYTNQFNYNGVIIGTNQLGYNNEETNFNPYVYIDLNKLYCNNI